MTIGDSLRRMTGLIKVEEKNGIIEVSGVPADLITRDISSIWRTGRVNTHMFKRVGKSGFSFPSFFAVEVAYLLRGILKERGTYTRNNALRAIIEDLEKYTWLYSTLVEQPNIVDFSKLNRMNRRALPTQLQFLEIYNKIVPAYGLKGFILSAAPGSGKTFTNLLLGVCLDIEYHIVVSPKNAVYDVWKREILDWVRGSTVWVESEGKPYRGEKYLVCHYETLPTLAEIALKELSGKRVMVTLDESHNLNEISSLRTRLFIDMCRGLKAEHVIWSSGTPLKALGYEVIPILRTIDPLFTSDAEERFRNIFGRSAPRGLDILKNRIGLLSFTVTKEQVRPEKPSEKTIAVKIPTGNRYTTDFVREQMRIYINQRMEFYAPQMKEHVRFYEECVQYVGDRLRSPAEKKAHETYKQYIAIIRKGFDSYTMGPLAKYCNDYEENVIQPMLLDKFTRDRFKGTRSVVKYLTLKVMGEALGNILGKARVECHVDMADSIDFASIIEASASKTVIFTSYVAVLEKTEKKLRELGYDPIVVYGKTNKDLNDLLEKFKTDPLANPILATYKSLSTAIPLVSASSTIFIDQPFRDYIKKQAEARTDRLGQTMPVSFFNCLLDTGKESNISTRSNDILEWSKAQVEAILGKEGTAIHIETVDSYYEGFESLANGLDMESYPRALTVFESTLESAMLEV